MPQNAAQNVSVAYRRSVYVWVTEKQLRTDGGGEADETSPLVPDEVAHVYSVLKGGCSGESVRRELGLLSNTRMWPEMWPATTRMEARETEAGQQRKS